MKITTPPFAVYDEFGVSCDDRIQDYAAQCVRVELEEAVKELAHWKQWAAADLVRSMINEGNDNG